MKSTWFRSPLEYEFCKLLMEADTAGSVRMSELFNSFLTMAFASLRQAVYISETQSCSIEIENEWKNEAKRYKNPKAFGAAFGAMIAAIDEKRYDFLGSVYSSLGCNDIAFAGQCFTPDALCQLLAEMTIGDLEPDPNKRVMFGEPAVGGGAICIAVANALQRKGFMPRHYCFDVTDKDYRCVQMCYIQLSMCGVPAFVRWGNALWPKAEDKVYRTILLSQYPRFPKKPEPVFVRKRIPLQHVSTVES